MPASRRAVFESLSKADLVALARDAEIAASGLNKPELVDELARARRLPLDAILQGLSRDQLKAACRAAGLDDSGRAKQDIIDRLLGTDSGGLPQPPTESQFDRDEHGTGAHASPEPGVPHDRDLQPEDIARLTSVDAIAAFLHDLGYPTDARTPLEPSGIGLPANGPTIRQVELLSDDEFNLLQVIFVQLHSVTAKARADLVRALGKDPIADRMLILTSDFDTLEFVLIEKETRSSQRKGPATKLGHRSFVVPRRWPHQMLKVLRRLTYTMDDGLRQYDKLKSVFDAAHFSGTYFLNRALFSDHFLETRLKEDLAWSSVSPGPAFESTRTLAQRDRLEGQTLDTVCQELYDPLWSVLGFRHRRRTRKPDEVAADYELNDSDGEMRTVALTYPWGRWLDGPDPNDADRPAENPGAAVVTLLERGDADWVIVTNGQLWRLYSKNAHSRSTNFYEVDLPDVLIQSGLSDPNEAFRYWWLFFRLEAFLPCADDAEKCWLDTVVQGSREYAAEVEEELKRRVFYDVVPALAEGFIHDRRTRLKQSSQPTESELEQIRQGTLTFLYRLLFLLYAESRDLLPVREAEYYKLSLKSLKEEIASKAGVAQSESESKLTLAFKKSSTDIYDRLSDPERGLFAAMAHGRSTANVPRYNGGLFRLDPAEASDDHEAEIAEFLNTHRVPDRYLAIAIDRLARVEDSRMFQLAFVDYKSLGVRQLGSIYEGLLEFKLRIAAEDLAVTSKQKYGDWIALSKTRSNRRSRALREIKKGEPYLVRDKAERKSTGSYYTPDHIVEYIVENTVGPVLERKTEALRDDFRKAERTYHKTLANAEADARLLLGWTPAWGGPREGPSGSPSELDRRRFAAEKAYEAHKQLVEKLFDLKVLDPAMGSGHFLVEAVDFITDELLDFLNAFPVNPVSSALEQTREAILASLDDQGIETDELIRRQLTDIHLLKRHVLKRCIYGVDLNPLATELAKVSLWLDAFTLGAPLSFLDHHLRTGNSLIGSSVLELEAAVEGQLFKIDESHLLRAVQKVLFVARLADATASEVAESKQAFDDARRTLASYRILLDILVARHFGFDKAVPVLMEMAPALDPSSGEALMGSFRDKVREEKLKNVKANTLDQIETLARSRSFLHWDLEFPEVFYEFAGIGEGRILRRTADEAGFDAVVGNPPYDVLSELENSEDLTGIKSYIDATESLRPSLRGKNNLYKLFICRSLDLLARSSQLGLIVPMGVLGLDQMRGIREAFFEAGSFRSIDAFPQKDDPARRVFFEAKLATAIIIFERDDSDERGAKLFSSRQHPANRFDNQAPRVTLSGDSIPLLDPINRIIVTSSPEDWDLAIKILQSGRVSRLQDSVTWYQGEVNETVARRSGHLVDRSQDLVIRGASICLYAVRQASQGDDMYLDAESFLSNKALDSKAHHHRHDRVVMQNAAPQNNFRRLIGARLPAGHFCSYKLNYCLESESRLDARLILALLNSKLCDWFFRIGSTSADINHYQLDSLPCPRFETAREDDHDELKASIREATATRSAKQIVELAQPLCLSPPFPSVIGDCLSELVDVICRIEAARGDIARRERSALSPDAQPLQEAIDRILFLLAGLTQAESQGLEERLARML